MRDLANNIGVVQSIAPQVLSATTTGSGIDLLGFGSAAIIIATGAIVSSGNFTPTLEDSDDDSTYAAVTADQIEGTLPSALSASAVVKVGYVGFKRYVRPVLTKNSGTSIAASVNVIKGHAAEQPVS
jgi:hypothetical protein